MFLSIVHIYRDFKPLEQEKNLVVSSCRAVITFLSALQFNGFVIFLDKLLKSYTRVIKCSIQNTSLLHSLHYFEPNPWLSFSFKIRIDVLAFPSSAFFMG